MRLERFSMGIGDRFGMEGEAQLRAFQKARGQGVCVSPVWNKSHREHEICGTQPGDVRKEADAAVEALGWKHPYAVDADHINLSNVDPYLAASDFFTIDVADYIGEEPDSDDLDDFVEANADCIGSLSIPGVERDFAVTAKLLTDIGGRYLYPIQEAGRIYRHITAACKRAPAIEVSMDEAEEAQTPVELFFILSGLAAEGIPLDTIAPKFSGRFNKGVDYVGDPLRFAVEFDEDVAVLAHAVEQFDLPPGLRLSIHSGSDKFSLYREIRSIIEQRECGLHVKTAGTTWLEELIGLARAGAVDLVAEIYRAAYERRDEFAAPYATVIKIREAQLPKPSQVKKWSGEAWAAALEHDQSHPDFNPDLRQLCHIAYKAAAELGDRYLEALAEHRETVGEHVENNLYQRHIEPLFIG